MPKAIVVHETGGPEKLTWEDVPEPVPGKGQARVRQTAIGLNFIDVYFRKGIYKAPGLPFVPGQEGAGVVDAVGPDVTEVKPGDRVAYGGVPEAYAEVRLIAASRLVVLPPEIDDRTAAAMMLKGMTAEGLLLRCGRVRRGDTILFHAAAGGVGTIACQWAKHLGVEVIGTAGGPAKVEIAKAAGCAHVIDYTTEDVLARVKALTSGAGVSAAFDSVGKDTFMTSLDCLRPRGILVSYGQSSGSPPPLEPLQLGIKGSLFFTRPILSHYIATREELLQSSNALFEVVKSGAVKIRIGQTHALRDAAVAHRDLESRKTTGSTVLLP